MYLEQILKDLKNMTSGQGWGRGELLMGTEFPCREDILKWTMALVTQATKGLRFVLFETGSYCVPLVSLGIHYIDQGGPEHRDPPCLCLQSASTKGVHHRTPVQDGFYSLDYMYHEPP